MPEVRTRIEPCDGCNGDGRICAACDESESNCECEQPDLETCRDCDGSCEQQIDECAECGRILDNCNCEWDDIELEPVPCSICNGPGELIGELGKLAHYRCRNCGMVFSREK